ncbi:MAG: nitrous oxide reductase accessory protein NosL [Lewinellaceae bacterium]|mgnify:CR=1 FL=1|nr:nitrous oxide reductase accessory protein NosL [Saprospiraceae bacterium]MCB9312556.1 nitrous oxide reductase accessory protein NosL [Lewinellaceae bacterium]HRW76828.1 nitrous oxide reductase accessory protein NosL [Saprospiraceae bacterium]
MRTLLILFTLSILACSPGPQSIRYGEDACYFCKMTIVDQQHSAEAVTAKGKVYKFDAIECLVQYIIPLDEATFTHLLVADFDQPGSLIDARTASYLVSPNLPSPMGAFLNAFDNPNRSASVLHEQSGTLYSWDSLKENMASNSLMPR